MKILYFNLGTLRKDLLTWNNYLNKSGFSGTEAQLIEYITELRKRGHTVWTFMPSFPDTEINKNKLDREYVMDLDLFCIVGAFIKRPEVSMILKYIPAKCQIIILYHSITDINDLMTHELLPRFKFVCVSNFVANQFNLETLKNPLLVIPNGINKDVYLQNLDGTPLNIYDETYYLNKKGNFAFYTSWGRGGEMSYNIFKEYKKTLDLSLKKKFKFLVCDYLPKANEKIEELKRKNSDFIVLGSLSKRDIKSLLDKTDYFIYALYNPVDDIITHDTYGCSIHEALACGVSVITWNVACYKEIFGDNIHLIEPLEYPDYKPFGGNKEKNRRMGSSEGINLFVEKIREIERNLDKKLEDKIKARKWALEGTWEKSINKFLDFVNHT
jgi:glycosyltransferase involved in cell wall biosynthesis